MKLVLILLAFAAGMLAPIQAGMNAKIGKTIHDPLYAALISFVVGAIGLLTIALALRTDFTAIRQGGDLHWATWGAGLLGACYVTATIILTPRLGTALTFSLVVAGQLVIALIMDHYGVFGIPVQAVNLPRIIGIILISAGVLLIRRF
jgi:transporter family-2 protein